MREQGKPRDKGKSTRKRRRATQAGALETELKLAQEKQQAIVKTAIDGFWIVNSEGRLLEVNDSYCKMIGYTREELLKMSIQDIEAVENPEDTVRRIKKVVRRGSDHFETRHKRKNGRIIDVEVNINCPDTEEGQILVFLRDITERKQAEGKLSQSEKRYRSLFETIAEGVVLVATNGNILQANPAAERLLGLKKSEIEGRSYISLKWDIVYPDGTPMPPDMMAGPRAMREQQTILNQEMGVRHPDGSVTWINVSASPLIDASGELQGIVGTFADITERKHQEAKIEHLNQLLHAIFNVSEFISKETDPDRLIKGVCDTLIKARSYHHVWVALLDKSAGLTAAAEAGLGEDFLPVIEEWKSGRLPACAESALRQPEVVVTRDTASTCTACPLADKYVSGSALGVRLEHEGRVYGMLSICTTSIYTEDEEELSLLLRIAGDIAFALHSIELEKQRRRAVDALVDLSNLL